jgi:hypothetical protein
MHFYEIFIIEIRILVKESSIVMMMEIIQGNDVLDADNVSEVTMGMAVMMMLVMVLSFIGFQECIIFSLVILLCDACRTRFDTLHKHEQNGFQRLLAEKNFCVCEGGDEGQDA